MKNAAGKSIKPTPTAFAAAAATADWASAKDFNLIMTNAPGAEAWPITATTWVIMYKQPKNAEHSKVRVRLLQVVLRKWPAGGRRAGLRAAAGSAGQQIEAYWASEFKHVTRA